MQGFRFFTPGDGTAQNVGSLLGGVSGFFLMIGAIKFTGGDNSKAAMLLVMFGILLGMYAGKKIADRIDPFVPGGVYALAHRLDGTAPRLQRMPENRSR